MSFGDLGLDLRIVRALGKKGFSKPTSVQLQSIPRTLEGKDVVARARTGSGKTLAYLLPAIHKLLNSSTIGSFKALILVPTRELCQQVQQEATSVIQQCGVELVATSLTVDGTPAFKRVLSTAGQIVVSTPGRIASALREGLLGNLLSENLQFLVLDEADLLLTYGYESDLELLAPQIPRACQCLLMSATANEDLEKLQKLVLHNPITLNLINANNANTSSNNNSSDNALGGGSGSAAEIEHFAIDCKQDDRLLYTLTLLKMNLIRKKALIFVNSVDEGVRLRLFLEAFGIRPALLNAELPLNSRSHILASFNRGLFDYLIASDEVRPLSAAELRAERRQKGGGKEEDKKRKNGGKRARVESGSKSTADNDGYSGKGDSRDEEFGVTRGIDFKGVRTVINFSLPASKDAYIHRVGRTGRAGESGIAISFFGPEDEIFKYELKGVLEEGQGGKEGEQKGGSPSDAGGAPKRRRVETEGERGAGERQEEEEEEKGVLGGEEEEEERKRRKEVEEQEAATAEAEALAAAAVQDEEEEILLAAGKARRNNPKTAGSTRKKEPLRPYPRLTAVQIGALRYRAEDVARSITKTAVKEARAKELRMELLNSEQLHEYFEEHAAAQQLLRHDKPLASTPAAAHLKMLPTYLKDPLHAGVSGTGKRGGKMLRVGPGGKKVRLGQGRNRDSSSDPLRYGGSFLKGPKKGKGSAEEMTEMEVRAMEAGKKEAKKFAKKQAEQSGVDMTKLNAKPGSKHSKEIAKRAARNFTNVKKVKRARR